MYLDSVVPWGSRAECYATTTIASSCHPHLATVTNSTSYAAPQSNQAEWCATTICSCTAYLMNLWADQQKVNKARCAPQQSWKAIALRHRQAAVLPTWLTFGEEASAGRGMAMTMSCRSKLALLSYSMLTYESAPEAEGQQLMVSGTSDSSLACSNDSLFKACTAMIACYRLGSLQLI